MKSIRPLCLLFLALCAPAIHLPAQPGAPPPGTKMDAAMTKLFGDIKAFTAKAEVQATMRGSPSMTMTMDFALLDGKTRSDLDMANMKSAQIPPQAAASMKQMGMDRISNIIRPDRKRVYLIYPGLRAYVDMAMPAQEAAEMDKDYKIDTTPVGKETVEGHPCVKNRVVMTDDSGNKREGFTWTATDLKDFPVKMQIEGGARGDTFVMTYRDIKLARPDASLFDPPSGLARHENLQSLMQSVMQKMMGGQAPGLPGVPK